MTAVNKSKSKRGNTRVQWRVAILANTTLLTYGLQAGWISPMTKVLQSELTPTGKPLSDNEISWIASALCLSAMFGVPIYTYISDTYGRRVSVVAIAILQALSWIIKLSSNNATGLIIARICCGIPAGGCFIIIPMYIREISQDNIRGLLGTLLILMQNIGILLMYAMGPYMNYFTILWLVLAVSITTAILMLKAPESPAFLVKMGKIDEATVTVAFLRGLDMSEKSVQHEINCIRNEEFHYKSLPDVSIKSIFKDKAWRHKILLVITITSIAACNGSFVILTYASAILSSSGVTISPELQALSFPAVMIIGSLGSMTYVERVGRKKILACSFMITVVSLVCLASTQLVEYQGGSVPKWLPVIAIVTSLCAYSAGVSPIPYIVMSELFNFQIRAKVMGFIVTHAWFVSFIQLASFGLISNAFRPHTMFYCFAGVNLLGVFVCLILLPETKGKSLEQFKTAMREEDIMANISTNYNTT